MSASVHLPTRSRLAPAVHVARPVVLLLLAATLAAPAATASTLTWKSAVSGNAGTSSNWTPTKVPGSADDLFYTPAGKYTVTFDATVPASHNQTFRVGGVDLSVASPHTIGGNFVVGSAAGDVGTASLIAGTVNVASSVLVAGATSTTGTVNVGGVGSILQTTGALSGIFVGSLATGTLNLRSAGQLIAAGDGITIGNAVGSTGTVNVFGVETGSTAASSLITTSSTVGDVVVGNSGAGTLNVTGGSLAIAEHVLNIARNAGSSGTVTVAGTDGGTNHTTLEALGELDVAHNATGGVGAGTGVLQLLTPANVLAPSGIRVGDPDGGSGTLRVRSGVTLQAKGLVCDDAHGVFDFDGGSIDVDGGTFHSPGSTLVLDSVSPEQLELEAGTTAAFNTTPSNAYSLVVGNAHLGTLTLASSAHVDVSAVMGVGLSAGSNGSVNLGKSASISSPGTGQLVVGFGGSGTLDLTSGGTVNLGEIDVAALPGSHGSVSLSGAGTQLTTSLLQVGGLGSTAGGSGTVTVGLGGAIQVNGGVNALNVLTPGTLTLLSGGTVTTTSSSSVRGSLVMTGGRLASTALTLQSGSTCSGFGTFTGEVINNGAMTASGAGFTVPGLLLDTGGTLDGTSMTLTGTGTFSGFGSMNVTTLVGAPTTHVNAIGDLVIGANSMGATTALQGTLTMGSHTVTFDDLGHSGTTLGRLTSMNGGTLVSVASSFGVPAGDTLTGAGTINATLTNLGILSPGVTVGTLTLSHSFAQTSTGKLIIEIGSHASDAFDHLNMAGAASLGGTLDVRLLPGTVPQPGQDYAFLNAGTSLSGTFATVTINGQPAGSQITINYGPKTVTLHVNAITVDVPDDPATGIAAVALVGRSGTREATCFDLALPRAAHVELAVFGAGGRRVAELFRGDLPAGRSRYMLRVGARALAPGLYFARAVVTETATKAGPNDDARVTVRTARAVVER